VLSLTNAEQLAIEFMTPRLDYCNAVMGVCPTHLINKLQLVQNKAARFLIGPGSLTILTRFCQHCIGSLLNILHSCILKSCQLLIKP